MPRGRQSKIHDPSGAVAFEAFVYNRVMGKMRTRFRNECAFGQRFVSGLAAVAPDPDDSETAQTGMDGFPAPEPEPVAGQAELDEALALLGEKERLIVVGLYWDGLTEPELGVTLGVKRRAVNKRKLRVLAHLLEHLGRGPVGPRIPVPKKRPQQSLTPRCQKPALPAIPNIEGARETLNLGNQSAEGKT